jgi:hypothetical protein
MSCCSIGRLRSGLRRIPPFGRQANGGLGARLLRFPPGCVASACVFHDLPSPLPEAVKAELTAAVSAVSLQQLPQIVAMGQIAAGIEGA